MPLVLADVGADVMLKAFFNNSRAAGGNNFTMKLFCTNVTPAQSSVAGDFVEAAGGGYASKALVNGSFTVNTANDPSDVTYAAQVWTFTGPLTTNGTIYGVYVVDADGVLVYAEATTPYTPSSSGDIYSYTQKFQLSSGTPA